MTKHPGTADEPACSGASPALARLEVSVRRKFAAGTADAAARCKARVFKVVEQVALRTSDHAYLALRYRRLFGRWPSFRRPRAFTERILLYKLSTRGDPRLPMLADKVRVKDYVAGVIGEEYVVPTLWHGTKLPSEAKQLWPKPYVIKATHGSLQYLFVRADETPDWHEIEATTTAWLSEPYRVGQRHLEWHYEQIPPQLIVEPMLGDGRSSPADWRLWVFSGRVKLIQIDEGREPEQTRWLFDREWIPLPFKLRFPRGPTQPDRPANYNELIRVAETLAQGFEYVRVDLYNFEGRIYFGEMTFFPGAGMKVFEPQEADYTVGEFWTSDARA